MVTLNGKTIFIALASTVVVVLALCGLRAGSPDSRNDTDTKCSALKNPDIFDVEEDPFDIEPSRPKKPLSKPFTTASGVEIQEIEEGFGLSPSLNQLVIVHYTGYLSDGVEFESSRNTGIPLSFIVGRGRMVPGFEEGIMGMKVGGKRKLIVPPHLAYGKKGNGIVPSNATLTYEVHLLSSDR